MQVLEIKKFEPVDAYFVAPMLKSILLVQELSCSAQLLKFRSRALKWFMFENWMQVMTVQHLQVYEFAED